MRKLTPHRLQKKVKISFKSKYASIVKRSVCIRISDITQVLRNSWWGESRFSAIVVKTDYTLPDKKFLQLFKQLTHKWPLTSKVVASTKIILKHTLYYLYKSTSETKLVQLNVFGMSIGILMKAFLCIDIIHNFVKLCKNFCKNSVFINVLVNQVLYSFSTLKLILTREKKREIEKKN